MPRPTVKKPLPAKTAHTAESNENNFSGEDEGMPDSQQSGAQDDLMSMLPAMCGKSKKRKMDDEGEQSDFSGEMQKMLECFGADITKTLLAKRKRLEQYTQASLKTSNQKVEGVWRAQQNERKKLNDEFQKQVTGVFQQWETDVEKSKEQEEKLASFFRQQQKLFQQTRVVQTQRLKTIRQLHEQFIQGMQELEKAHTDQQSTVHGELKKEMAVLQKRILMDTQQQEMASVRKSLQTMLF